MRRFARVLYDRMVDMAQTLLILADDLTGMADCAARCVHAGLAARIVLEPPTLPLEAGVTALTSDSRHLPPGEAARRVHDLVAPLRGLPGIVWYKKIDSTLRGNLGAELDAMLDALGALHAVICPAFPAQRRGLRAGWLMTDPGVASPVHLPTLLAQQSCRPVAAITLEEVRAGVERLAERMRPVEAPLIVVDGLNEDDLATIVRATARALPDALLCGSAGLAGRLTTETRRHGGGDRTQKAEGRRQQTEGSGPETSRGQEAEGRRQKAEGRRQKAADGGQVLFVVGSGSSVARRQIAYLRQHCQVEAIEIEPGYASRLTFHVSRFTHHILLHLPEPGPDIALDGSRARACAGMLADAAEAIIVRARPARLVLVGGDTAMAVLRRHGIARLTVLREVLPGIPLAVGSDRAGYDYAVVLKAGNHGDEATLATILQMTESGDRGQGTGDREDGL